MKVVQINVSIGFGSTGRIVDHIGELIERNGGICYYIHGSRYITHNSPTAIQVGTKLEDYTHYAISLLTGRDGLASIFATKKLVKLLKEIQPDIVHLHNIHGYFINYKILFDYLSNEDIPIVWTFHDCWPITGHCAYFDSVNCKKWQTGCFNCLLLKDYPKSLFFDQSSYNYRLKKSLFTAVKYLTIVPVSDWLGKIVKESYLKDSEIYVIHNGVDTSVFKPEVTDIRKRYKIPNEKKIILGVASGWDERKGYSGNVGGDFYRYFNIPKSEIEAMKYEKQEEEKVTQQQFDEMMNNWIARQAAKEPSAWSEKDREWAEENGIIKGTGAGFSYLSYCTREQMVAFLHRVYDMTVGSVDSDEGQAMINAMIGALENLKK